MDIWVIKDIGGGYPHLYFFFFYVPQHSYNKLYIIYIRQGNQAKVK
nr:MAG TPA: hypothetical protein [Caudoviricetes sp.]